MVCFDFTENHFSLKKSIRDTWMTNPLNSHTHIKIFKRPILTLFLYGLNKRKGCLNVDNYFILLLERNKLNLFSGNQPIPLLFDKKSPRHM